MIERLDILSRTESIGALCYELPFSGRVATGVNDSEGDERPGQNINHQVDTADIFGPATSLDR
jgi:hypothetical protein